MLYQHIYLHMYLQEVAHRQAKMLLKWVSLPQDNMDPWVEDSNRDNTQYLAISQMREDRYIMVYIMHINMTNKTKKCSIQETTWKHTSNTTWRQWKETERSIKN